MADRAMAQRAARNRGVWLRLLSSVLVLGFGSFQFGDRNNLNSMPFTEVASFASDLAKAQQLAKQGNVEILAGRQVRGEFVRLRGELTDGNCYFESHVHAYDHAFCGKLCVAAGSPLVFIADQGGQVYLVLTARNAVRIGDEVLDVIGVPGIMIRGKLVAANQLKAFALEALDKPQNRNRP